MTLFYPGDGTEDEEEPVPPVPAPETHRASVRSGLRTPSEGGVRHFTLSSVKREEEEPKRKIPSIAFPNLRDSGQPEEGQIVRTRQQKEERAFQTASAVSISAAGAVYSPDTEIRIPQQRNSGETILEVHDLHKGYVKGKNLIPVLNGVDIQVQDSEFLAIVGQSGSGKSTLLHLMGTLDVPDSGTVHFDGQRIDNLPSRRRDYLRNHYIGMIFQFYHLIPEMTMIENVLAPLMVRESLFGYMRHRREYIAQAKELLNLVGLSHRMKHRPNELSGGEMQRTSIARALITHPRVLLADEPTGNLDSKTTLEIIKLLRSLNAEKKLTIIMVTHDMEQARDADRVVRLVDGRVVDNFLTGV